jgi:hypothetical protein
MAITRKPKATTADNFIENGGSAAISIDLEQSVSQAQTTGQKGRPRKEKEEEIGVKLRLPTSLLEQIDNSVESRKPVLSRHQWILEAIYAKLDRE